MSDGSREQLQMTAGLDLGDKYSHLCLIDSQSGEVMEGGRLRSIYHPQIFTPPLLLYRFSQLQVQRIHLPRTRVNKDKRKRLRYILSTQLLPLDVLRQELAGCILL
jgi:hypothetical protein